MKMFKAPKQPKKSKDIQEQMLNQKPNRDIKIRKLRYTLDFGENIVIVDTSLN